MITDTHAHIFPEKIARAAVEATGHFYENVHCGKSVSMKDMTQHGGTAEELLECGRKAGIGRFLVFSTATTPHQVESVNSFIARECEAHSGEKAAVVEGETGESEQTEAGAGQKPAGANQQDCPEVPEPVFVGAGTMHIDYPDFEKELDRAKSLGLKGIKLHPDIQRFALDDERILPLYGMLGERNMFLIAHTGDYRYRYSNPDKMEKIAKMFPKTKFIAAHFGGWGEWEKARHLLVLPNVYVDTSSTWAFTGAEAMKEAFRCFDHTHIFFGSDYPMWDPGTELETIYELGLDEETLAGVLNGNFERFLAELG